MENLKLDKETSKRGMGSHADVASIKSVKKNAEMKEQTKNFDFDMASCEIEQSYVKLAWEKMKLEAKSAFKVETKMQMPPNKVHAVSDEDFERLSKRYGNEIPSSVSFTLEDKKGSAPRLVIMRDSVLKKGKKEFFESLEFEMFRWAFKTVISKEGLTEEEHLEELSKLPENESFCCVFCSDGKKP